MGPRSEKQRVNVSVRVRPLDKREKTIAEDGTLVVKADTVRAVITVTEPSPSRKTDRSAAKLTESDFQFDNVFWSLEEPDASGAAPASQEDVFQAIGLPLVKHAFDGFNSCLFAYGQTGSGKTYTMMGADVNALGGEGAGVTPRICLEIFHRKGVAEAAGHSRWTVSLGYVEVYNERVSDLIAERRRGAKTTEEVFLEVREHPTRGAFIDGQRFVEVNSLTDVVKYIEVGNAARHTAATKMNERSSRSHAIVMLLLREERTMTTKTGETITTAGMSSRMNLVDLAGSERVAQSQVEGQQFKEATHINLSLTTLGRVIDMLADMAKKGGKSQVMVPPYRESKLTFILKDSLGGNSKTFMVAAVSPSEVNYDETLSTLRYASRARDIVNVAQVNEDPRARRIRELEDQMALMRGDMSNRDPAYVKDLESKLSLLEAEAQKRAADLQALEKEREQSQVQERLLRATEAEKDALAKRAAALQQETADSRRQASEMEALNRRLREEQAQRERELLEENARKDAALSSIRRTKDAEIESGRQQLERTLQALERERAERQTAADAIREHQQRLTAALADGRQSTEERHRLQQQNAALATELERLSAEAKERDQLLRQLARAQQEAEEREEEIAALGAALETMELKYHAVVFFFLSLLEMSTSFEDTLREQSTLQEGCQHQCEVANLETLLEGKANAMQLLNAEAARLSELHALKDTECASLRNELAASKATSGDLERELADLTQARQALEQDKQALGEQADAEQERD
ncbi:kinesin K39 [Strigomonas culicis]|uniref:Kinesin-like protein n=1 Tax=Strigomonas culicis TaxID=28005 RepID=S9UEV2_9TRYP|nr:kinesin K39 [Strigomonas culicis]|eukprot:EPY29352.1 kinesin K39 [Strigomonas culicis]